MSGMQETSQVFEEAHEKVTPTGSFVRDLPKNDRQQQFGRASAKSRKRKVRQVRRNV